MPWTRIRPVDTTSHLGALSTAVHKVVCMENLFFFKTCRTVSVGKIRDLCFPLYILQVVHRRVHHAPRIHLTHLTQTPNPFLAAGAYLGRTMHHPVVFYVKVASIGSTGNAATALRAHTPP